MLIVGLFFFFFQAEDGIRDYKVTGVQTCALPIWEGIPGFSGRPSPRRSCGGRDAARTGSAWWLACARGGTGNELPPRVGDARFILLEHAPNQSPQPALRQVLGQRINRHDPTQMDEILLSRLNDFGFRMVDRARPERYDHPETEIVEA